MIGIVHAFEIDKKIIVKNIRIQIEKRAKISGGIAIFIIISEV